MSHATTAAPITPAESLFGLPTFTKIDATGAALPPTAEAWAAVRVTLGDQAIDVLAGNVGGRKMSTDEGIEACRNIDALGSQDWRLWTRREAEAALDLERWNPAADPQFFPDIQPDWYCTASPVASDPDYAWFVGFSHGYAFLGHRDTRGFVRAVRSVAPASAARQ